MRHSLWKKVITTRYGELDGWITEEANNPYGVTVWRSIRNWWTILRNHTTISVGNGNKTIFWKDRWLGNWSLAEKFPDLFDLVIHQDRTITDMWELQGWELNFRRNLND